jgi:hypothetical protein
MDQIKEELSGYAMELAPSDLPPNTQVGIDSNIQIVTPPI